MVTAEELRRLFLEPEEQVLFDAHEIRDTATHPSNITDMRDKKFLTIFVVNELDQSVSVQPMGNWRRMREHAVPIGTAFTVDAGKTKATTIDPTTEVWLPWFFCQATASVAPTKGTLTIRAIKKPL